MESNILLCGQASFSARSSILFCGPVSFSAIQYPFLRSNILFCGPVSFSVAQHPFLCSSILFCDPASFSVVVSPAYGFSALALVKCSNEGGPGPRHNMKEDPGTSTRIMKREHGQEVPCDPGQVTSILGSTSPPLPPPPTRAARTEHPPTPFQRTHPSPEYHWRPASEKTHFGLGYKIRGHGMGKRRMRRPL
jgi:hypothetical protein